MAKLCSSSAGGKALRQAGRVLGAGRGFGIRELCAGRDLGQPRVLSVSLCFGTPNGGFDFGLGFGTTGGLIPGLASGTRASLSLQLRFGKWGDPGSVWGLGLPARETILVFIPLVRPLTASLLPISHHAQFGNRVL